MAAPPPLKGLRLEDFPGSPAWFQAFLELLSGFVGDVSRALDGQLDSQNIRRVVHVLRLKTLSVAADTFDDSRVRIPNRLPSPPSEVRIGKVTTTAAITAPIGPVVWSLASDNLINIEAIPGLDNDTQYEFNLVVE